MAMCVTKSADSVCYQMSSLFDLGMIDETGNLECFGARTGTGYSSNAVNVVENKC